MDIFEQVDPADLVNYVRIALADAEANQFTLAQFLPTRTIPDLEYRFNRGGQGLIPSAMYRTFDAEAPIGSRPGTVRVSGELPPISQKIRLGEYDRLRLRNADREVQQAVFDDAATTMRSVAARIERARGEVLTTGAVNLSENGVTANVDFGRNSTHTVTAATKWNAGSGTPTPLADLITWNDLLIADTGVGATDIIMSKKAWASFKAAADVISVVYPNTSMSRGLIESEARNAVEMAGLPPVTIYDAQVDVAGTATRVIDQKKVVLLNRNQLGNVLSGITAEQLELGDTIGAMDPGIVAVASKTFDPVAVWTKAAAIALPVLANPDLTVGATVLA